MKKLIQLLLLFCCISSQVSAQTSNDRMFFVQPDGSFLTSDSVDFVVMPTQLDAHSAYDRFLNAVKSACNVVEREIETTDDKLIRVIACKDKCITYKLGMMGTQPFTIKYRYEFLFKDNKVRINAPIVADIYHGGITNHSNLSTWLQIRKVFNKKGKVKEGYLVEQINKAINEDLYKIINYCPESTTDDW